MHRDRNRFVNFSLTAFLLAGPALCTPVWAQEAEEAAEEAPTWTDEAELSYVATGGNSESSTLAMRNTLTGALGEATVTFEAGALRAETTSISRVAVGTTGGFTVQENSLTELTAENYFLRGRYDRPISERLFWFAGAGWDRNEFAGIKNRTYAMGGVGHVWFDDDGGRFQTDYGLTYTDQEDVVVDPTASASFLGYRLGWDYLRNLGATTSYGNVLILDGNADRTSDYRADMTNSLAVSMSERLALKVSLQLLFDNEPSLAALPLFSADGAPLEALVLAPLDDLDTVFTAALVIKF